MSRVVRIDGRKRSKYRNRRTDDGFASRREKRRFNELCLLQMKGEISDLKTQVPFVIIPKNSKFRACKYIADFTYLDSQGQLVVEDAKGFSTYEFKIKQKLMYHMHGIEVVCV